MTKRAEKTYCFERGLTSSNFIQFGYWDSLRKGLLSGERLWLDLKRLELAYHDFSQREYELTRHASLLQLNPKALLQLRMLGKCTISVPEELFDLDCPGYYFRRIKSVSLSIPCVAGPYSSLNCSLTLLKRSIRRSSLPSGDGYARAGAEDSRFSDHFGSLQSIVTSSGQSDSGLFETNLRDERYLPFEGSGAISEWQLELPDEIRQFNYDTISDVIIHLRYTAREGEAVLRNAAVENLKARIEGTQAVGSVRLFSVRHEFPGEWAKFKSGKSELSLDLREEHYPFWSRGILGTIKRFDIYARTEKPSVEITNQSDGSGKVSLLPDPSLDNLRAGTPRLCRR
jgi:receptor-binding and translocation channel-forming TcA subunit of Tc toxin